jgi:hypothetical protein
MITAANPRNAPMQLSAGSVCGRTIETVSWRYNAILQCPMPNIKTIKTSELLVNQFLLAAAILVCPGNLCPGV